MIPFNFNSITVKQYQTLNEIFDSQDELIDKQINAIAYLTNKSTSEVEAMDLSMFKYYSGQLSFVKAPEINTKVNKYVWVKGKLFKGCLDLENLSTGQYIDLKELGKDGNHVKNLHKLLACIYSPMFFKYDHKKCSEIMLNAKMGDVYGLLFFYTNELERLNSYIRMCSEEALQTIQNHLKEVSMNTL